MQTSTKMSSFEYVLILAILVQQEKEEHLLEKEDSALLPGNTYCISWTLYI